jgi:hypothetical protein
MGQTNNSVLKYVVAAAGIAGVTVIECVNLYVRGPDSTVTSAIVGAVTFIVGLVFGRGTT